MAVVCRSKEESDKLRALMYAHNINWGSGRSTLEVDHWNIRSRPYIIYNFRECQGRLEVYHGYTEDLCKHYCITCFEFSEINTPERECNSSLLMEFYK